MAAPMELGFMIAGHLLDRLIGGVDAAVREHGNNRVGSLIKERLVLAFEVVVRGLGPRARATMRGPVARAY